jgi:cobalt/nickel transport system permease protein
MSEPKTWEGVDATVIEKVAIEAGRPPREPLINTDQGDLLLWLFLLAGAVGGFVVGYSFRTLFPPTNKAGNDHPASP